MGVLLRLFLGLSSGRLCGVLGAIFFGHNYTSHLSLRIKRVQRALSLSAFIASK
jgi:hypothetical protein